jgi:DNA repair photolyase
MAPLLPGLTDRPEQLAAVVRAAREAGACGVWASMLHLKPGTREHFLESLARDWPELVPEYERRYARRAYPPAAEVAAVRDRVRRIARDVSVRDRRRIRLAPAGLDEQLSLLAPLRG